MLSGRGWGVVPRPSTAHSSSSSQRARNQDVLLSICPEEKVQPPKTELKWGGRFQPGSQKRKSWSSGPWSLVRRSLSDPPILLTLWPRCCVAPRTCMSAHVHAPQQAGGRRGGRKQGRLCVVGGTLPTPLMMSRRLSQRRSDAGSEALPRLQAPETTTTHKSDFTGPD